MVVGGEVLPPVLSRLGIRLAPGAPFELVVAGSSVLGAEVTEGVDLEISATRIDAGSTETAGPMRIRVPVGVAAPDRQDQLLVLASEDGAPSRWRVRVAGRGKLVLTLGRYMPPEEVEERPSLVAAPLPPPFDPPWLPGLLGKVTAAPQDPGRVPGSPGSLVAGVSLGRAQLWSPKERLWWTGTELEGWRRSGRIWQRGGIWTHGSRIAGGGLAEIGRGDPGGWEGLRLEGGAGQDAAGEGAGHVGVEAFATRDLPQGEDGALRFSGSLRARWVSAPPLARVDPDAWTLYAAQHPVSLELWVGTVQAPLRDLRWTARVGIRSNSGPSLDRTMAELGLDLLLAARTTGHLGLRANLRLPDADRAALALSPTLRGSIDSALGRDLWRHLRLWAEGEVAPLRSAWSASTGVRVVLSRGRGLGDQPPYLGVFSNHLEEP